MSAATIIEGYAAGADALIAPFEAISSAEVYAHVLHLLPRAPARIAEIGAGTGRDAAWLAGQGHSVLAVEPVDALREAGRRLHPSPRIEWLADALPELARTRARGEVFDLVLLTAVWQHLDDGERRRAMPALASLVRPGGRLIVSVRHGPGAPSRPCHAADPRDVVVAARACGLSLLLERRAESVQAKNRANGVTWTWLALEAGAAPSDRAAGVGAG